MFHHTISISTPLQYTIDLAIAGLEDNPDHPLRRPAKRPLLRTYRDAWNNLSHLTARHSNTVRIPLEGGFSWELAGGVLGQSVEPNQLRFDRLGSKLRGIEPQTWTFDVSLDLRDFTMDPGQDLLVALHEPLDGRL